MTLKLQMIIKYESSIGALSVFIDELQDENLQSMSIYTGRQFVWRHFQKVLVIWTNSVQSLFHDLEKH